MGGKRRPDTRFLVWAERWLMSSTRVELTTEQRAIWMDFLALAAMQGGHVEVPAKIVNRKPIPDFSQLAGQLGETIQSVEGAASVFRSKQKVTFSYDSVEKKFFLVINKWNEYQPEYLWGHPSKLYQGRKKNRSAKPRKNAAHLSPYKKGKERKEKEREEDHPTEPDSHSTKEAEEPKSIEEWDIPDAKESHLDFNEVAEMRKVKRDILELNDEIQDFQPDPENDMAEVNQNRRIEEREKLRKKLRIWFKSIR